MVSFYFWMDIISFMTLFFDIHWITNSIYQNGDNFTKENIIFNILKTIRIVRLVYIMKFVKNSYQDRYYSLYDYMINKLKLTEKMAKTLLGRRNQKFSVKERKKTRVVSEKQKLTESETGLSSGFENNLKRKFVDDAIEQKKRGNILVDEDDLQIASNSSEISITKMLPKKAFESRLARRIIYLTNKRLMMMILTMLVFVPMFSVQFFTDLEQGFEKDVQYMAKVFHVSQFDKDLYADELNKEYKKYKSSILQSKVDRVIRMMGWVDRIFLR